MVVYSVQYQAEKLLKIEENIFVFTEDCYGSFFTLM